MSSVSTSDVIVAPLHLRVADKLTARERGMLVLVLGGLIALYGPTFLWLYQRWTMSVWHHAHGFLIPPVVAYFVAQELRVLRDARRQGSPWGFLVLVPALLLHMLDTGIHTQLLSAASLVLALPGLSLLFLGIPRTRAILFPLAFLVFMLPIPLSLTEQLHLTLRQIATAGTEKIVTLLRIPIFSEGTTLHLTESTLFVGDACSGFSTLYAAIAVACLTAYTATGARRKLLVLISAVPLAMAANLVRVTLLVLVVVWKGEAILNTWIHPFSGMLTFALALPIILWLGQETRASREAV